MEEKINKKTEKKVVAKEKTEKKPKAEKIVENQRFSNPRLREQSSEVKGKTKKYDGENPMREVKIEKIVFNVGATGADLEKGVKLLKYITGIQPMRSKARKRIPTLNVRPGLEIGAVVTMRKNWEGLLKRMLVAIDNTLKRKQMSENNFSFGIPEYIEIPGLEFQRDIGIMGLDVTIVFKRTGRRVRLKKIKRGRVPRRQDVTKGEIIKFMEDNYDTRFEGKMKKEKKK